MSLPELSSPSSSNIFLLNPVKGSWLPDAVPVLSLFASRLTVCFCTVVVDALLCRVSEGSPVKAGHRVVAFCECVFFCFVLQFFFLRHLVYVLSVHGIYILSFCFPSCVIQCTFCRYTVYSLAVGPSVRRFGQPLLASAVVLLTRDSFARAPC